MTASIEQPRVYEQMLGTDLYPDFPERMIPVPPEWVRQRVDVPALCEYATLAKDVQTLYPASVRKVLVDYVAKWESNVLKYGSHLVVTGHVSHHRRNWAASAVMNEITMRYSHRMALSVGWLGAELVRAALAAKAKKDESFYSIRNRLYKTKLLLIDTPGRVGAEWDAKSFMEDVYTKREWARLPTITTLNVDIRDGDWTPVRNVLGNYITDVLEHNTHGFVAHY